MMSRDFYTFDLATGMVLSSGRCASPESLPRDGVGIVLDSTAVPGKQYVESGKLRDVPAQPSGYTRWNPEVKQWVCDPMTIRLERDRLLASCDWTQVPDSPLTPEQKQAWADYRQALRDFPSTCDPNNPVWPVRPD